MITSSSAAAERPREPLSQLKYCQLLHNCTKNHIWLVLEDNLWWHDVLLAEYSTWHLNIILSLLVKGLLLPLHPSNTSTKANGTAVDYAVLLDHWTHSADSRHTSTLISHTGPSLQFNHCPSCWGGWVSSFLTAHQHIIGYLVPYNGEKVIKMWRYNQGYLATINVK